jgi:hypothetical protein
MEFTIKPLDNQEPTLADSEEPARISLDQPQQVLLDPQHDSYLTLGSTNDEMLQSRDASRLYQTIQTGEADSAEFSFQVDEELDGNIMKMLFSSGPEIEEWVNI